MKPFLIANWKMNPETVQEASKLFNSLYKGIKNNKKVKIVVCPPFVYLPMLKSSVLAKSSGGLTLGSQNCFWERKGAFTGEISPSMLKYLGCKYIILGHSERRKYLKETDQMINRKIKLAISLKLNPILCLGETKEEREKGETFDVLKAQLSQGLKGISRNAMKNIILAYEPIWAIGTGKFCFPSEVQTIQIFFKKLIARKYGRRTVQGMKILYGGSVNSQNVRLYIKESNISGVLVGGASLNTKEFLKIIEELTF